MAEGQYLVGVDIGSSAIKVCQLRDVRGKLTLVKFGYHALPAQTIVDGHVMNQSAIVDGLNKLFSDLKIRRREIALSVSGHSVIIKRITLPLMTAAELAEQIGWEAEQQIPFDIKDVQIDYEVLRRRPEQGQMDVLLVAAKRDELTDTAQIVRDARLKPVVIDVDAFTIQHLFEANYRTSSSGASGGVPALPPEGTVALINVGATLTTINILASGVPAFTRDIANGGNAINDEIRKQLGITFEEAELYKSGGPDGPAAGAVVPTEVPRIIRQVVEGLAGEIQRSLDFYLATSGDREIHKVYLTGGSSNIAELAQAIERRAHTKVELLDPFREIAIDPKEADPDLVRARATQATVAMGLALRRDREKRHWINLLPSARRNAGAAAADGNRVFAIGLAVALTLTGVGLFLFHASKQSVLEAVRDENRSVDTQIRTIRSRVSDHQRVRDELAAIRAREDSIAHLEAARTGPTSMLIELSHLLSPGGRPAAESGVLEQIRRTNPTQMYTESWDGRRLWLTRFTEENRDVVIQGDARTMADVGEFMRRMMLSRFFENVHLERSEGATDDQTRVPVHRYRIAARVRY